MNKMLLICAAFGLLFTSCDTDPGQTGDDFDRSAMLRNMADNLIKPAYADLMVKTGALQTQIANFTSTPNTTTLSEARASWESAYTSWQSANAFNFGPAGEEGVLKGLIEEVGTFPVSEPKVATILSAGQWNTADFNRDARGFLTVEYLLYGTGQSDAAMITAFQNEPSRAGFLNALASDLVNRIIDVNEAWNGAYAAEFIANAGTDAGSSTSQLYNEFVRSYEALKNFKVGLPLGKRAGQTTTEPLLTEAYYSGKSLFFLKKHLATIENIWYGRSTTGVDGIGFREYLASVEGGGVLITNTETQLTALRAVLDIIPETPSFSSQISSNFAQWDALHTELQKLTRYLKSDMSSLLGIAITFSSSDGD